MRKHNKLVYAAIIFGVIGLVLLFLEVTNVTSFRENGFFVVFILLALLIGLFSLGLFLLINARKLVEDARDRLIEQGIRYWRGMPVESKWWNNFEVWALRIFGSVIVISF